LPGGNKKDSNSDGLAKLLKTIEKDFNIMAANMMKMALLAGMCRGELFKLNKY